MASTRTTTSSIVVLFGIAAVAMAPADNALARARAHAGAGQPVCGWRADGPKNYASAAAAARDHAHVVHLGPCLPAQCGVIGFLPDHPMCGRDPLTKARMTYPNRCAAEHAQAIWLHDGSCRRGH